MEAIYQLPPILQGSTENQLQQLRDYLVRIVRQLPTAAQAEQAAAQTAAQTAAAGRGGAGSVDAAALRGQAVALKALIVKTADRIYETIDVLETRLGSTYVAQSDFGTYQETVDTRITTTARETVESYDFQSQIDAVAGSLAQYKTAIDGEIRRGFLPDPDHSGEYIFGIAVAQKIVTTGTTRVNAADGMSYEGLDLDRMAALGLYTASGWQFWINGVKAGWFDAADGLLHAPRIVVENELKIGADWLLTGSNGFGVRYMGG